MSERKDIEKTGDQAAVPAASQSMPELPTVQSPPLSPEAAEPAPVPTAEATAVDPVEEPAPAMASAPEPVSQPTAAAPEIEPVAAMSETVAEPRGTLLSFPPFAIRPRHKRYALLAASVVLAAALGAVVGAVAGGGFSTPAPRIEVAAAGDDRKAMQQSIAKLGKEVTSLKASLEAANKSAHSQIAKISERFDRAASQQDVTGSISPPQTVPAAPAALPQAATPIPTPRPLPRLAAVESQPPARPTVVQGWTIRDTRDGYVYVEGHGDIYEVIPGAPLPGLGPVESVRRQDGRWVVTTPKGIIVSLRDRRFFESF
jgi:hypothetical protein